MLFAGNEVCENVSGGTGVSVTHMKPPLKDGQAEFQFWGSAELDANERRLIKDFVDSQRQAVLASEKRSRIEQYVIYQEDDDITPEDTLPRYSCATYVTSAYEQAAIELVVGPLPLKNAEQLKSIYTDPQIQSAIDDPDKRHQLGIGNGTEWPIMMVGYLLNSLSRSPGEIRNNPYQPVEGDEYFPRQGSNIAPESTSKSGGKK